MRALNGRTLLLFKRSWDSNGLHHRRLYLNELVWGQTYLSFVVLLSFTARFLVLIAMTVVRGLLVAFSLSVLSASKGSCASSSNFARDGGPPTIQLDNGTFVGNQTGNATQFLGIPYALPPCVSSSCILSHSSGAANQRTSSDAFEFIERAICASGSPSPIYPTTAPTTRRPSGLSVPNSPSYSIRRWLRRWGRSLRGCRLIWGIIRRARIVSRLYGDVMTMVIYGGVDDVIWDTGLNLDVIVPTGTTADAKLPVVVVCVFPNKV